KLDCKDAAASSATLGSSAGFNWSRAPKTELVGRAVPSAPESCTGVRNGHGLTTSDGALGTARPTFGRVTCVQGRAGALRQRGSRVRQGKRGRLLKHWWPQRRARVLRGCWSGVATVLFRWVALRYPLYIPYISLVYPLYIPCISLVHGRALLCRSRFRPGLAEGRGTSTRRSS